MSHILLMTISKPKSAFFLVNVNSVIRFFKINVQQLFTLLWTFLLWLNQSVHVPIKKNEAWDIFSLIFFVFHYSPSTRWEAFAISGWLRFLSEAWSYHPDTMRTCSRVAGAAGRVITTKTVEIGLVAPRCRIALRRTLTRPGPGPYNRTPAP
jgi:hypothetical protein